MKPIHLEKAYIIRAPRKRVVALLTDFERFPTLFPTMAKEVRNVKRNGNDFSLELVMSAKGKTPLTMTMHGTVSANGFSSVNLFWLGVERESFSVDDHPEGTTVRYVNDLEVRNPFVRIFGVMFVKKAVLKNLDTLMADLSRVVSTR